MNYTTGHYPDKSWGNEIDTSYSDFYVKRDSPRSPCSEDYKLYVCDQIFDNSALYLHCATDMVNSELIYEWSIDLTSSIGVVNSELGCNFWANIAEIRIGLLKSEIEYIISRSGDLCGNFIRYFFDWLFVTKKLMDLAKLKPVVYWVSGDDVDRQWMDDLSQKNKENIWFNFQTPYPHEWYRHCNVMKKMVYVQREINRLEQEFNKKYKKAMKLNLIKKMD